MKVKVKVFFLLIFSFLAVLGLRLLIFNTKAFAQTHLDYAKMLPIKHTYVSSEDEEFFGYLATDNSFDTRWSSVHGVDPQWIVIDLGKERRIKYIVLCWEEAAAAGYRIEVSMDNERWLEIYNEKVGKRGLVLIPMEVHTKARYVRVFATRRTTEWGYSLYEFQVFGI